MIQMRYPNGYKVSISLHYLIHARSWKLAVKIGQIYMAVYSHTKNNEDYYRSYHH
jgi:hypothetical protein